MSRLPRLLPLLLLPLIVHAPALSGWLSFDPVNVVSGMTAGAWTTNGVLPGYPGWIDGNAGVTTEALGRLAARDWLHGEAPWWNPYSGVGLPLAAEGQNSAFFLPFVLLLAWDHGLLYLRILLMAVAGVCTEALLRRLRLGAMPALVGGALFQLNGTFAWGTHGPIMPVAFLPMLLLGLEAARDRRPSAPPLIAGALAWSLVAGFPETAYIDGLLGLAWAGLRLVQARGDRLRYAMQVGGGGVLGLMLAAPGIWPFIEALPRSFLGSHEGPIATGIAPANYALLLFPYLYGSVFYGPVLLGQQLLLWYTAAGGYTDLVLAGMAALALRRGRPESGLRVVLLCWLVLSFGKAAEVPGLAQAADVIPFVGITQFRIYVPASWSMALAVLAAFALDDWQRRAISARGHRGLVLMVLAAGAAAAVWAGRHEVMLLWRGVPLYWLFPLLSLAGAGSVVIGLAWCLGRAATTGRSLAVAILLVANAAVLFAVPLLAGTRGRVVDTGTVAFLSQHIGLGRVLSFGPLVPNYGAFFGVAEIGHNYLPVPKTWVSYVRAHLMPEMDGVNFYEGAASAGSIRRLHDYAAAGVSFVLTRMGEDPFAAMPADRPALAYRGAVADVWALPGPAAYFEAAGCTLDAASRLDLTARCPVPARLIRRELAWPGWTVRLNGRPGALSDTLEIFQAVDLPEGETRVQFAYAPPGIGAAWAVCGAAVLILPAWVFALARHKRYGTPCSRT